MIERAVEAGLEPVSFLLGERWLDQLSPLLDIVGREHPEAEVPVFVGDMSLLERFTGFSVTAGRSRRSAGPRWPTRIRSSRGL